MDIERIQNYIAGNLKGKDLKEFEEALKTDADLRIEVELQREMLTHLAENEQINAAKSVISDVHQSYLPKPKEKLFNRWAIGGLAIAASFALFFIVKTNLEVETSDELYATYFNPSPASFGTKGDESNEVLQRAELQFNRQNYEEALSLFEEYNTLSTSKNGEVSFHQALCLMALGSYDEAISQFDITKSEYPLFDKDCNWNLALIYIKTGELNKAKGLLKLATSGSYAERSKELLRKIERLE